MIIVGCDPGNKLAGVAAVVDGSLVGHSSVELWRKGSLLNLAAAVGRWAPSDERVRVYMEVPQNGTHRSRGGVHFAAGMIVGGLIVGGFDVARRHVRKVYPRQWRAAIMGRSNAPKSACVAEGRRRALWPVESDDEAEAIVIAFAGAILEVRG